MRASVAVGLILLGSGLALAGEGQVEIGPTTSFPIVINQPGSYLLTADLTVSSPGVNAIEIQADNVTLDLGGHSIAGPGSSEGSFGVSASARTGVTVRNGTVAGFGYCVYLGDGFSGSYVVEGVHAEACNFGFFAYRAVIRDCSAVANTETGIAGYGLQMTSTRASFNTGGGIFLVIGSCTTCDATSNGGYGFHLGEASCTFCSARGNATYGFEIETGFNLLTSCATHLNTTAPLSGSCTTSGNACFNSNLN
jgi:hypothetical protein